MTNEKEIKQVSAEEKAKEQKAPAENTQNQVPKTTDQKTEPDKDYSGTNATKQGGDDDGTIVAGDEARARARKGNGREDVDTYFDSDNKKTDNDASETVQDKSGANKGAQGNDNN